MSFINVPFAYLMKFCLMISGDFYWLALLFFALIMTLVLLPLAIKQQKATVKQASFRPTEMAIRKKYKGLNDRVTQQKMMTEIQEAQQKAGINAFGGCLFMLPELILVFILYAIVRAPITYSFEYDQDQIKQYYVQSIELVQSYKDAAEVDVGNYSEYIKELNGFQTKLGGVLKEGQEADAKNPAYEFKSAGAYGEYELLKIFKNENYLKDIAESYGVKLDESKLGKGFGTEIGEKLPNFDLLGASLLDVPSTCGLSILLLIPLLVFLTQFGSTKIARMFQPQQLDANGKPIGGGLLMEVGLPLMSAVFSYSSFSAAVGVYWIWRTVISVLRTVVLNKALPLPKFTEEDYAEAERLYKGKQKKKKKITIEVDEDDERYLQYAAQSGEESKAPAGNAKYTYNQRVEMLALNDEDDDGSGKAQTGSDDEML